MPNSFFSSDIDYRRAAVYDPALMKEMTKKKFWKDVSYSQYEEDMWLINNWFYGMKDGLIIESGALDGILYSNSHVFESYLNWTSVLVEADPENFKFLRMNRPNAVTINGALCNEPRLLHYSSLGVIPVRGFVEFMTPSFLKQWHGKIYNNKTKLDDLPTVQCMPMKRLLKMLGITHVDVWVLDVEGAEESTLEGTDFEAVHFNAIAMECDEHDEEKNNRKKAKLASHGFTCEHVGINCMCKHSKFQPHSKP